jgi:hypothetical protein
VSFEHQYLQLSGLTKWRQIVVTWMKRIVIIAFVVVAILYLGDFLSARFRIPARDSLGTVTVHTYYVVKLKNGRTEYDYAGDHDVNCSNSVFPQFGAKPCWYARRHTDEQITIDSGNPHNPHLF